MHAPTFLSLLLAVPLVPLTKREKVALRRAAQVAVKGMEGFVVHSESSTRILLRQAVSNGATAKEAAKSVFLNPVQQYNRDLSITAIRVWSKQLAEEKKQKRGKRNEKHESKKRKIDEPDGDYHFTCLEALSATGLRAIRYAKELPLLKCVLARAVLGTS